MVAVESCAGCGARAVANGRCEYCGASRVGIPVAVTSAPLRPDVLYGWTVIRPETRVACEPDGEFDRWLTTLRSTQLLAELGTRT